MLYLLYFGNSLIIFQWVTIFLLNVVPCCNCCSNELKYNQVQPSTTIKISKKQLKITQLQQLQQIQPTFVTFIQKKSSQSI